MKTTKTIQSDARGNFIEHEGVKYRPQIASKFKTDTHAVLVLPHVRTDDSWAKVRQYDVTETWEPQV